MVRRRSSFLLFCNSICVCVSLCVSVCVSVCVSICVCVSMRKCECEGFGVSRFSREAVWWL
jgi:hypothetical protein